MASWKFSTRSKRSLTGVHPKLVRLMYDMLKHAPYDFIVTCGVRSLAEQRRMMAQGKSQTMKSYHLPQPDGYGHAVDIALITPEGKVTWDNRYYEEWAKVCLQRAETLGIKITWGGQWKTLYDTPHYQLEPRDCSIDELDRPFMNTILASAIPPTE